MAQLTKEKELIEKKMQRIEKAKEQETSELRSRLEGAQVCGGCWPCCPALC